MATANFCRILCVAFVSNRSAKIRLYSLDCWPVDSLEGPVSSTRQLLRASASPLLVKDS
jgi:hypothetical protein